MCFTAFNMDRDRVVEYEGTCVVTTVLSLRMKLNVSNPPTSLPENVIVTACTVQINDVTLHFTHNGIRYDGMNEEHTHQMKT